MALKHTANVSTGTEVQLLDADIYDAFLVGIAVKEFSNFDDRSKKEAKYQFIYQVQSGEDVHHLKSAPLKIAINEKSNLYAKHLKPLSGNKSEAELGNNFDPTTLLGKQCRLNVIQKKGNDGKTYNEIETALISSKVRLAVQDGEIPEFFIAGTLEYELLPTIKVKKQPVAKDTASGANMDEIVEMNDEQLNEMVESVAAPSTPRKRPTL